MTVNGEVHGTRPGKRDDLPGDPFKFEIAYPSWYENGICSGVDPDLFFADQSEDMDHGSVYHSADAKKVCAQCPVEEMCAEYAIEKDIKHGIWGGTTGLQREKIRRKRGLIKKGPGRRPKEEKK